MNEQTYTDRLRELEKQFERAKVELAKEYVMATASHRVGDLVRDLHGGRQIIRVEQVSISWNGNGRPPEPKYLGRTCKVDGTPTKNIKRDATWEHRCEAYTPPPKPQKVLDRQFAKDTEFTDEDQLALDRIMGKPAKAPELPQGMGIAYGVGYEQGEGVYSFFAGPWPELKHGLEYTPDDWETQVDAKIVICALRTNQIPEALHEWDGEKWVSITKEDADGQGQT